MVFFDNQKKPVLRYIWSLAIIEAVQTFWITSVILLGLFIISAFTFSDNPIRLELTRLPILMVIILTFTCSSLIIGCCIAVTDSFFSKPWQWNGQKLSKETQFNWALVLKAHPWNVLKYIFRWLRDIIR
jgi:hypothetical protein